MGKESKTKEPIISEIDELRQINDDFQNQDSSYKKLSDQLHEEIIARKQAEAAIQKQKGFFDNVLESFTYPLYVIDATDYTIKLANSATNMSGFPENATCYMVSHRRDNPCDGTNHPCPLSEVKRTKKPVTVEHIHFDKDNNPRNVEVHAHPVFDDQGKVSQIITYCIDITERKTAEESLKLESLMRDTLLDNLPCVALILEKESREIVACNKAAKQIGAVPGKTCYQACAQRDDICPFCRAPELWSTNEPQHIEVKYGETYYEGIWVPLTQDLYVHYIFDITKRKQAEKQQELMNSVLIEKNAELENIIHIISHDLKTPLITVRGFSNILAQNCEDLMSTLKNADLSEEVRTQTSDLLTDDIPQQIRFIVKGTEKIDFYLDALLKFAKIGKITASPEKLDMNALLGEINQAMTYQVRQSRVELKIERLPSCIGDRMLIAQVFLNLLDNAIKYLDPNRRGYIKVSGQRKDESMVYCVEDNGIGIATKNTKKIFDIQQN